MTETDCKDVLQRLPALPESAQKVFCRLYGSEPVTGKDLREATGLPRRTLYTALQKLRDVGILNEQTSLKDSRQRYFWLRDEPVGPVMHEMHPYARWAERAVAAAT